MAKRNYLTNLEVLQVRKLRDFREELKEAEKMRCNCSGFTIQYEGCQCGRRKKINEIKEKIMNIVDAI